jgi:hypothetical protein
MLSCQLKLLMVRGCRWPVVMQMDVAVDSEATRRRGICRLNYARIPEARVRMEVRERGKIRWYEEACGLRGTIALAAVLESVGRVMEKEKRL